MSWKCPVCDTYNEDSAESCMVCGSTKRPAEGGPDHFEEPDKGVKVVSKPPRPVKKERGDRDRRPKEAKARKEAIGSRDADRGILTEEEETERKADFKKRIRFERGQRIRRIVIALLVIAVLSAAVYWIINPGFLLGWTLETEEEVKVEALEEDPEVIKAEEAEEEQDETPVSGRDEDFYTILETYRRDHSF